MAGDNDFEKTDTMNEEEPTSQMPDDEGLGKEKAVQVRDKTAVVKDIANAVDKARKTAPQDEDNPMPSAEEVADAITSTTDKLYETYESDGTIPTREAFAEQCPIPFVGEAVRSMHKDPFVKRPMSKKRIAAICAGCGLAVVLIAAGLTLYGTPKETPSVTASKQDEPTTTPVPAEEAEETYVLSIGVDAEGWDKETSSPVIIHVVNEEEGVDFYHAYDANAGLYLVVPASGDYEVSFISPINSDGSIYRVPDSTVISSTLLQGDDAGTDESGDNPFKFEKVDAEDVTSDEMNAIIEQVTEAIKKGDETLTGEAGVEIAETVKDNAFANASADSETIEESTQESIESSESGESSAQTGNNTGSANTGSNSSSNSSSSSSGSNTSSGSSQNSSSSSSDNSTSTPSKPQHTHNWVPVTTTVHHAAVYKTVPHAAVTEEHTICNNCGADITGNVDAHMKANILNGCGSYTVKTVVVQDAYDEQVLVSPAWDETVTTGYKCSCGATK